MNDASQGRVDSTVSEVLFWDEGLNHLEVRKPASLRHTPQVELVLHAASLTQPHEQHSRTVWRGPVGVLGSRDLSFVSDADAEWVVAGTVVGGATRHVVWWTGGDAIGTPILPTFGRIGRVDLGDPSEGRYLNDLFDAQVFRWRGEVYLAGSGLGSFGGRMTGDEVVWVARFTPLDGRRLALSGSIVARGIDPRFVAEGDSVVVSIRAARNYPEAVAQAAVRFYRTVDMQRWTLDESMSSHILAAPNYSIAKTLRGIDLVTTSPGEQPRLRAHSFDAAHRTWSENAGLASQRVPVRSAKDRIWLVPSVDASPLEGIVYTSPEGEMKRLGP
jgi:hypothetical protein